MATVAPVGSTGSAASTVSVLGAGVVISISAADVGFATGAALLGTLVRFTSEAAAAHKKHLLDPVRFPMDGYFDTKGFIFTGMSAPLIGMLALAGCRAAGIEADYLMLAFISLMGYWGNDSLDWALSFVQGMLNKRTGS